MSDKPSPCEFLDKINASIEDAMAGRSILSSFATSYPVALPGKMISVYCWKNPHIEVSMAYCPDDAGRDKVLAFIGQAWGADGWTRHENSYSRKFNWKKRLAGVDLEINGVETIPEYAAPVPPNSFPLMMPEYSQSSVEAKTPEEEIPF